MKIAIAVSGGVDSLYALISLKNAGHDVAALHARFLNVPKDKDPVPMLSTLCKEWDIPFHVVDLKEDFSRNVIRPFLESYAKSETPNPCVHCNKTIKFGRLLDIARNLSVESLATGHYVNMQPYLFTHEKKNEKIEYGFCLKSADDISKDQSYFLALTPIERLRFAQFPLANKQKKDIVDELCQKNIAIPIQKESQEVCFVPNDDYREFIELEKDKRQITYQGEGDIYFRDDTIEKKIARHSGLWRYTEGQRKGLGIAWSEALYVIEKKEKNNTLYVGTRSFLEISSARASSLNFLVSPEYWHVEDSMFSVHAKAQNKEDFFQREKMDFQKQKVVLEKEVIEPHMKAYVPEGNVNSSLFVRTRFREKPSPAKVFLEITSHDNSITRIELATKESFTLLKQIQESFRLSKEMLKEIEESSVSENQYLWHVQEENSRFESEKEKQFSQSRKFWHVLSSHFSVSLVVHFLSPKQVYAKGQVLAVYDKNGFLLVGGILE